MTMLDRMRRHKNWLKWSLGIVVLAMVIFFIPNFFQNPLADAVNNPGSVARVEGHDISADEYRRTYQAQIQAYRNAYGAAMKTGFNGYGNARQVTVQDEPMMSLFNGTRKREATDNVVSLR